MDSVLTIICEFAYLLYFFSFGMNEYVTSDLFSDRVKQCFHHKLLAWLVGIYNNDVKYLRYIWNKDDPSCIHVMIWSSDLHIMINQS